MADQHLITPPPALVRQWMEAAGEYLPDEWYYEMNIATQAARWGADMELEACCEELRGHGLFGTHIDKLRAARRPKPPSLKEQALAAQQRMWDGGSTHADWKLIRRALEALPDD